MNSHRVGLVVVLLSLIGAAPPAPKEMPQRTSSDPKSPLIFAPKTDDVRVGGLVLIDRLDVRLQITQVRSTVKLKFQPAEGGFNAEIVGRNVTPGAIEIVDNYNTDWPIKIPPVGALVYGCEKGPLADAGIRMADVIYKVNATPVADSAALAAAMDAQANSKGVLQVQRYNPRIKRYELKSVPFGK